MQNMTVTEAAEAWDNGKVAAVRRACMENESLYQSLKNFLTPEDYEFLTCRIRIRKMLAS